ncbi:SDR family oxidoreductase [Kovacikia minuta CCNUW1]|uniref:SDR family NAD(P)-dependent oxidoreductase n=1 Tax=Kovacikia minuta TaxID=2931930 RepID=UPI001CCD30F9|nr:SDR family oxidoreductase [Kovacikia minuta]UBF29002.1 SDR family oxidoreductase [Kovacikia minuta CCNUW1]
MTQNSKLKTQNSKLPMSTPLTEQVVLITGASAGIGAALAKVLAERFMGIRLVLAARNVEKLEHIATHCRKAGAEVLVSPVDLAQLDQAKGVVEKALNQFGQIDVLVNNAGYGQMGPVELVPPSACQQQFVVNVLGPLALIQAVIPSMRDRGGGRIINISSIGGRTAFPLGGLYSASKFALESLSDTLRMELEPFNIQVSVIEPGPVSTQFFDVAAKEIRQIISQPEETPYRLAFKKMEGLEQQTSANAWTSEQVAEVIIKAMVARRPHPRYVAATGGEILLFLLNKVLPRKAVDRFWQRFYGIDQVAEDWKALQKGARSEE